MNFHWVLWYNFYSIYFLFDYTNLYTVTYYFGMVSQAYLVWNYLGAYIYIYIYMFIYNLEKNFK